MLEKQLRKQMKKYLKDRGLSVTAFAKEMEQMSVAKTLYDWFAGGTITLKTWDKLESYMKKNPVK